MRAGGNRPPRLSTLDRRIAELEAAETERHNPVELLNKVAVFGKQIRDAQGRIAAATNHDYAIQIRWAVGNSPHVLGVIADYFEVAGFTDETRRQIKEALG